MKKILLLSLVLMSAMLLNAEKLTLFFTNDTHGSYMPNSYKTKDGKIELGGYENLYNLISAQRDTIPNSLWLDAGDEQTGSVFSSLIYKDAIGGAVIESFNLMGLDAATFGNHEFDQSFENTKRLNKLAKYPFISTNLVNKKNGKPFNKTPYKIFKKGNLRIGILGLTLTELPQKVKAENIETLDVLPYKQAIDKYIDELDKKTDLIILLTHIGIDADSLLATTLDNRIDLIVGGHTHAVTEQPMLVNGIYIVQAGSHLVYYGKLNLDIKDDKIVKSGMNLDCLFPVEMTETKESGKFMAFFMQATDKLDKNMNRVIGYTDVDWVPDKYAETAVSRWQAEALMAEYTEAYKPDFAMINCGGIRKAIPKGEITLRNMTEMLPFTNYIVVFSCKGSDLNTFLAINEKNRIDKPYDIIQSTIIPGQLFDPDKTYRVVSHDYVSGQWDKYLGFKPFDVIETNDLILDVMVKQVEKQLNKKKL